MAGDGNIYCLDAEAGTLVWKKELTDLIITFVSGPTRQIRSSPTIVDGKLYVAHVNSYVYCLDVTNNGEVLWTFKTEAKVFSSPAVVDGKVYIASSDAYFYCLSATDGSLIWKFYTGKHTDPYDIDPAWWGGGGTTNPSSPTINIADREVYLFAQEHARYMAFNMDTGNHLWTYRLWRFRLAELGGTTRHSPVCTPAYYDGSLYGFSSAFAIRLDTTMPKPRPEEEPWAVYRNLWPEELVPERMPDTFTGFDSFSSPSYVDGKVYGGSENHAIYVWDAMTGEKYSWYETGNAIWASPAIAYGYLYVGSTDGNLYCFEEGSPRTTESYYGGVSGGVLVQGPTTSLTATLSATEVTEDTPITVSGKLTHTVLLCHDTAQVNVKFTRPDGTTWESTGMTGNTWLRRPDDTYEITYVPDMVGTWKARAYWFGDTYNVGSESQTQSYLNYRS